jgi:general secretion pathway protein E
MVLASAQPEGAGRRVSGDARSRLTRHLLAQGHLTPDSLARGQEIATESGEKLEIVLPKLGLVSERALAEAFASVLKLPLAAPSNFPDVAILERQLKPKFLHEARLLPIEETAEGVSIAMANPLDSYTTEAVRFAVGKTVRIFVALPADLEAAHQRLYGEGKSQIRALFEKSEGAQSLLRGEDVERLKDSASDAPVVRLVNHIITGAVEAHASDIHIEPMENELRVRYRIDGVLQPVESPPQRLASSVISRVKIMARLNIAERRRPQDGRISLAVRGRDIDFRVSTVPGAHGESVVLRILDQSHLALDFPVLGFEDDLIAKLRAELERPHGIILVTGPTGSGKTTTLYTALTELNTPGKKLLTIEDPVEYQLDGIVQVQVKPQIGLSFANALRAFLRQNPDIMMVGEIRDLETAEVAVQAALTGHLILSTLHTNDAASAVTRLIDMGVEDYLLTSTLNAIAAQRLVRTLCLACRESYTAMPEMLDRFGLDDTGEHVVLYRPKGCEACRHTGFSGRTSILELLPVSDEIRQAILSGQDAGRIQKVALDQGMRTMRAHGLAKALLGTTTVEEVLRATRSV